MEAEWSEGRKLLRNPIHVIRSEPASDDRLRYHQRYRNTGHKLVAAKITNKLQIVFKINIKITPTLAGLNIAYAVG